MNIVHIHIGKTGGTSLRRSLVDALGPGACSQPFVQSFMTREDADYYQSFQIIHGHISRRDQIKWFPDRRVIAILRDPIERGLSFIRYVRSLPPTSSQVATDANAMSAVDLVDTHEAMINLNNTMVRQLGGHILDMTGSYDELYRAAQQTLRDALWVGRQDDMNNSLKKLSRMIGCEIITQRENVSPPHIVIEGKEEVYEKLVRINNWDLKLWAWAQENIFD